MKNKSKLALGALMLLMVSGMALQSAQAAWPYNNNNWSYNNNNRWVTRPVVQQRWVAQNRFRNNCDQNRFWQNRRPARFAPHRGWFNNNNPHSRRYW